MSKLKKLPRVPAIWRTTERKSPIAGEPRGTYLQVAVPNMAGRDFKGRPIPSFEKPYKYEQDVLITSKKGRARALHAWGIKYILKEW